MQAARNEYELFLAEHAAELTGEENYEIVYKGTYVFTVEKGQFNSNGTKLETTYVTANKVDLTANEIKSAKANDTNPPAVASVSTWYTDKDCKSTTTTFTSGTTYYYAVALAKDIGNAEVAIYVA